MWSYMEARKSQNEDDRPNSLESIKFCEAGSISMQQTISTVTWSQNFINENCDMKIFDFGLARIKSGKHELRLCLEK